MVSYYNTLPYAQKHTAANLAYSAGQHWQWPANYHTPPNQFLGEMDSPHSATHHQMYYPHMFHPGATGAAAAAASSDWHSPTSSAENFAQNTIPSAHQLLQQHHHHHSHHHQLNAASNSNVLAAGVASAAGVGAGGGGSNASSNSGSSSAGATPGNTQLNETTSSIGEPHIAEGLPSPPITVSGSEISSPGAPASSSSPHHVAHHLAHNSSNNNHGSPSTNSNNNNANNNNNNSSTLNNNNRTSPVKAHYYEWMKKPAYPAQPTPGKTRTKDKYRVVYTDYQRLELEKEYCTSRYITIRRKTELAQTLSLSERQVKIWFQNRRAKERKQSKKGSDPTLGGVQHSDYANMMDTKPKLEHLQHSYSMAAMGMSSMGLHHLHHSHSLAVSAQLHQSPHTQITAGVGSLI